jgi:hypothetical protein
VEVTRFLYFSLHIITFTVILLVCNLLFIVVVHFFCY